MMNSKFSAQFRNLRDAALSAFAGECQSLLLDFQFENVIEFYHEAMSSDLFDVPTEPISCHLGFDRFLLRFLNPNEQLTEYGLLENVYQYTRVLEACPLLDLPTKPQVTWEVTADLLLSRKEFFPNTAPSEKMAHQKLSLLNAFTCSDDKKLKLSAIETLIAVSLLKNNVQASTFEIRKINEITSQLTPPLFEVLQTNVEALKNLRQVVARSLSVSTRYDLLLLEKLQKEYPLPLLSAALRICAKSDPVYSDKMMIDLGLSSPSSEVFDVKPSALRSLSRALQESDENLRERWIAVLSSEDEVQLIFNSSTLSSWKDIYELVATKLVPVKERKTRRL